MRIMSVQITESVINRLWRFFKLAISEEWETLPQMDTSPNGHFPNETLPQLRNCPFWGSVHLGKCLIRFFRCVLCEKKRYKLFFNQVGLILSQMSFLATFGHPGSSEVIWGQIFSFMTDQRNFKNFVKILTSNDQMWRARKTRLKCGPFLSFLT